MSMSVTLPDAISAMRPGGGQALDPGLGLGHQLLRRLCHVRDPLA